MDNLKMITKKELREYIKSIKSEYIGKYFAVGSKRYLPDEKKFEGLSKEFSLDKFWSVLETRMDFSGRITNLTVTTEDLWGGIMEIPVIKLYYGKNHILLTESVFKNNLIVADTLEEAETTFNLIKEVE